MNNASVIGRLGKDIEMRVTQSGKTVASFSLAVNDAFDKERTHWIDCVIWGKGAEILEQYTSKGSQVGVSGNIQTRNYEDNNGIKRKQVEINVRDFTLLDSKNENSNSIQSGQNINRPPRESNFDPFQDTESVNGQNFQPQTNDDGLPF